MLRRSRQKRARPEENQPGTVQGLSKVNDKGRSRGLYFVINLETAVKLFVAFAHQAQSFPQSVNPLGYYLVLVGLIDDALFH